MTTLEDIIRIALCAHSGQKDMVGNPAILHVLAVGLMGRTDEERKAGLLHDVVEDSELGIEDLRERGVEEAVLEAVDLLTHREGTSYEDYVRGIVLSGNRTAIQVKLNDLHHNLRRAGDAQRSLDRACCEQKALLDEIMRIAAVHERAERYIRRAVLQDP